MAYQLPWFSKPSGLQKPVDLTVGYEVEGFCFA
jgi:hypothetical protein